MMAVLKLFVLVVSAMFVLDFSLNEKQVKVLSQKEMFVLDAFDGTQAQNVVLTAKMLPYNPETINWDMRVVGTFCAAQDADKPREWLQRYGWAATCGVTPCGDCVQATNPVTGASVVARVVDQCHYEDAALELGFSVLKEIDRDGRGNHNDGTYSLDVGFNFVDCQDS